MDGFDQFQHSQFKSNSFDQKINTYEENETTELRTGEYIQGVKFKFNEWITSFMTKKPKEKGQKMC